MKKPDNLKQLLHIFSIVLGPKPLYLCKEWAVGNQQKLEAASNPWEVWASRVVICLQWSKVSCRDRPFLLSTWIPLLSSSSVWLLLPLTPNNCQCQVIYIFFRAFVYLSNQCTGGTALSSATCGHLFLFPVLQPCTVSPGKVSIILGKLWFPPQWRPFIQGEK